MGESLATSEERTLAVVSHLAPIAGYVIAIGHILLPLIIFLWKGKNSDYVKTHALESLNFQISVTIYWIFVFILMFLLVGFLIAIPLALFQLIVMIIAAVRAGNGQLYRYPLSIRFVK